MTATTLTLVAIATLLAIPAALAIWAILILWSQNHRADREIAVLDREGFARMDEVARLAGLARLAEEAAREQAYCKVEHNTQDKEMHKPDCAYDAARSFLKAMGAG